jgi:hypothetical protein
MAINISDSLVVFVRTLLVLVICLAWRNVSLPPLMLVPLSRDITPITVMSPEIRQSDLTAAACSGPDVRSGRAVVGGRWPPNKTANLSNTHKYHLLWYKLQNFNVTCYVCFQPATYKCWSYLLSIQSLKYCRSFSLSLFDLDARGREHYVMGSFMICTLRRILLGPLRMNCAGNAPQTWRILETHIQF